MKNLYSAITALAAICWGFTSCVDTSGLESELTGLEDRVSALEEAVTNANDNAVTAYHLYKSGLIIMDINAYDDGTVYRLDMSDGSTLDIHISEDGTGITPVMGVDTRTATGYIPWTEGRISSLSKGRTMSLKALLSPS